jgi:pterin-4a-carbinolamine dehydratase
MVELPVFVSYRRDPDLLRAELVTRVIETALNRSGRDRVRVFRDIRMRLGTRWPDEVRAQLLAAKVVLVLIGPGWLAAKDQFARRRIDQADDWVRLEIEMALANGKAIVPVAFGEALPSAEALPESIRDLLSWQAAVVRKANIDADMQPVLAELLRQIDDEEATPSRQLAGTVLPYPDPPMKVPPAPMTEKATQQVISEVLPGWDIVVGEVRGDPGRVGAELHRSFQFGTFRAAIDFMVTVADFAEKANHHPRWENIYRTVDVYLTTWDIGHQISHLDVMLASYLDRTFAFPLVGEDSPALPA